MEEAHLNRHGFSLRYKDGRAVLVVSPEKERLRPVYADDITARMRILGIPPVSAKKIREIISRGSGKPEVLIDWPAGAQLSAHVSVNISEDGMKAEVVVQPPRPGGAPVDREMINTALSEKGVIKGIEEEALRGLLRTGNSEYSRIAAWGEAPVKGRLERTECLFVTHRGKPWKELNSGRIDLKELNFIQNRKAGELLARHIPAIPSKDGFDVLGTIIEAEIPEKEILIEAGEGVVESEEGLTAEIDGNVRLSEGVITVEPTVNVKDVNYSTGNIDFDGSVSVEGTVADGFTVRATGDIQIGKTVGRGQLFAGRNLVLLAGFAGDGEGFCKVQGSLYSKFLEGAKAEVTGDLVVTEAVLHSEIEVEGNLILNEGRGEITGGSAMIGGGISCKRIGNIYAGATRIFVGSPPEKLNDFFQLGRTLKLLREEIDDLDRQYGYLKSKSGTDLQELQKLELGMEKRKKRLQDEASELKIMRKDLAASEGTVIAVQDRLFPGASITFGLEEYHLGDKAQERVLLRLEGGRIVVHGLKPGEEISFPSDSDQ